jgi:hypothetical protein
LSLDFNVAQIERRFFGSAQGYDRAANPAEPVMLQDLPDCFRAIECEEWMESMDNQQGCHISPHL